MTTEIPYGYCHCGCGGKTNIAKRTIRKEGLIRGQPNRYCQGHAYKAKLPEDRFWNNVRVGTPDECWLWTGNPSFMGYGTIGVRNEQMYVHRYSWILHNGPIPDMDSHRGTMVVRHKCDTPLCVNPMHLELGTQQDNLKDTTDRGHTPKGSNHWNSKLTESNVIEIKILGREGKTGVEISKRFGVTAGTISGILAGDSWKNLNEQEQDGA